MSEHEDRPAVLTEETPAPQERTTPEILVFAMQGGFLGAVINVEIEAKADNFGQRYKTQLVLATTPETIEQRCLSTLIAEYGMTQEDALVLVPGGMTMLTPGGAARARDNEQEDQR